MSDAYESLPSSIGISFFLTHAQEISIHTYAAQYIKSRSSDGEEGWLRKPYASKQYPESILINFNKIKDGTTAEFKIFGDNALMQCFSRRLYGGRLVTISMINSQYTKKSVHHLEAIPMYLFQAGFSVNILTSEISEYPSAPLGERHPEDEELELIYANKKTYGIGHGCSATWETEKDVIKKIVAEYIPIVEVPSLTTKVDGLSAEAYKAQDLKVLGNPNLTQESLGALLHTFVDEYKIWHGKQEESASTAPADRIIKRQKEAIERMRSGIDFLTDPNNRDTHFKAFKISQLSMLRQFVWSRTSSIGPVSLGEGLAPEDSYNSIKLEQGSEYFWRPFQLAFQLLTIESVGNEDSTWRDIVDLLWFPTGGGKTEAYLALIAYEIAKRRLIFGRSGGGTSVWMRYTLRLLTSQQFERCATLISVLEDMRRQEPELLGAEPITLGLWVGATTTPNRLATSSENSDNALEIFREMRNASKPENKFQLTKCPKCGTRIVPEKQSAEEHYGVEVTEKTFRIFCPDQSCSLHERIPVSIVDDDLYAHPPTMLLGTIDKFARTLHEISSLSFFGLKPIQIGGQQQNVIPPSLIIQDELHLIDGPLGTIAGIYEAGFDTVFKDQGMTVKYIAATATILRANEQISALYGRDGRVFPPTGITVEDSFFSKEDENNLGRTYVGVMNSGLYKATTTLVQASAAGLQSVKQLAEQSSKSERSEVVLDSYWTQVIYHNSRQELGKTTTLLRDDVDARINILETQPHKRRKISVIKELSANLKRGEIREALDAVQKEYSTGDAIDVLPCTNMLSVGVDISRLGQMIVKGQPKSTAEYIQATSRVGRDNTRPPGIVITLFSSTRPRDRSHYETFVSYHQALYRNVEPSTVTPFSPRALDRTLHAAYVFVLKSLLRWDLPEHAQNFRKSDSDIKRLTNQFKKRLRKAVQKEMPQDLVTLEKQLNQLISIWDDAANHSSNLKFMKLAQFPGLLTEKNDFEDYPNIPWPILNSMRHVDGETNLNVQGD